MINDVLAEAKRLKTDAKVLRDIGDTDGAMAEMDRAIAIVQSASEGTLSPQESDIVRAELADCWGIRAASFAGRAGYLRHWTHTKPASIMSLVIRTTSQIRSF